MRLLPFVLLLAACPATTPNSGDDDDSTPDYPEVEEYDFEAAAPWFECPDFTDFDIDVQWAPVFDGEESFFGNLADDPEGTPNRRDIESVANLPTGDWKQIGLMFQLECPDSGLCDHWDRAGSLQVSTDPDDDEPTWVEVARYVTPYRTGMCQFIDVTDMASLLQGRMRFRNWIDTWVNPGHNQGEGWKVTAKLYYWPGPPTGVQVSNLWGRRSITVGEIEDDANVDSQVAPVQFSVAGTASRVRAHLITTGHSFGNSGNCAEFCEMQHVLDIDGDEFSTNPWRADCDQNPVSPQQGTWEYPRNGWCPGAISTGHIIDVTDAVEPGEINTLDFDILLANGYEYDNVSPVDLLPYTFVSLKLYTD